MKLLLPTLFLALLLMPMSLGVLIDPNVMDKLETSSDARVIVTYSGDVDVPADAQAFYGMQGFAGNLSQREIADLSNNPNVETIQLDWQIEVKREDGYDMINADIINNLTVNGTNITGGNQSVCVLDTGINYSHPEFGGCNTSQFTSGNCSIFPYGKDYVNGDNDPYDLDSHGTHVSGIIHKVAPDANQIIMKVCDDVGDCYVSDITTAVSWCDSFKEVYNITAVTMSIGDSGEWSDDNCFPYDSLAQSINNAYDNGLLVTVASGNEGFTNGINYPACARGSTSVGASTKTYDLAGFTNRNGNLDLLAPGTNINSTVPSGYAQKTGTSMATPFAAASGLLAKQYFILKDNDTLNGSQLSYNFQVGGTNVSGYPLIDLASSFSLGYECYIDTDCGQDEWINDSVCVNNSVYQNFTDYECVSGNCTSNTSFIMKEDCTDECKDGACIETTSGGGGGGGSAALTNKVKNITIKTNSQWDSNSINPMTIEVHKIYGGMVDVDEIEATLTQGNSSYNITLVEAGKGIYKGNFTQSIDPGNYTLEVRVEEGLNIKREYQEIQVVELDRVLSLKSIGFTADNIHKNKGIMNDFFGWLWNLLSENWN